MIFAYFCDRQVLDNRWEYGRGRVIAVVDLQKEYDKVLTENISGNLRTRGVRKGIVESVKKLYNTGKSKA